MAIGGLTLILSPRSKKLNQGQADDCAILERAIQPSVLLLTPPPLTQ
jgi:hypothetical protein